MFRASTPRKRGSFHSKYSWRSSNIATQNSTYSASPSRSPSKRSRMRAHCSFGMPIFSNVASISSMPKWYKKISPSAMKRTGEFQSSFVQFPYPKNKKSPPRITGRECQNQKCLNSLSWHLYTMFFICRTDISNSSANGS